MPALAVVVNAAKSVMGVSEAYARWWYAEMEARDWTCADGMRVSTRNWRPQLKAWWNRAKPEEREEAERALRKAEEAKPRTFAEGDWTLCAERCAAYRGGGRCGGGCIVPPDRRPRPIPPEDCQHFSAKGGGTAPDEREAASTPSAQSGRATTPPEARTRHRGKEDAV